MHVRRTVPLACVAALAVLATSAHAAAPGWSTPHTVTSYRVGTYAAGPNGQGVQIFGNGSVQTMTAQMRAIKSDATQGTAVGVNAGQPGFDLPQLSVNANGRLVAAWTLDTQQPGGIGLAAALGARTSLPRSAIVLPTDGQIVTDVATTIDAKGNGVVAWIQSPLNSGDNTVKAATLRPGQPAQVATLNQRSNATVENLSVGVDSNGRPTATWAVVPAGTTALSIAVARGDGTGAFAGTFEEQLGTAPITTLETFVLGNGGMLTFWVEGTLPNGPLHVKTSTAQPGGFFVGQQALSGGTPGLGAVQFAANAGGRAAVLFPLASGGGTTLRAQLRTSSGTWGSPRSIGGSGRYTRYDNVGVDAKGRVVALWDDGSVSSGKATRILAARSSSSSDPLAPYNQVSQRSGDKTCNQPDLFLSTSGDGLGLWQCSNSPRLARLTKPS